MVLNLSPIQQMLPFLSLAEKTPALKPEFAL